MPSGFLARALLNFMKKKETGEKRTYSDVYKMLKLERKKRREAERNKEEAERNKEEAEINLEKSKKAFRRLNFINILEDIKDRDKLLAEIDLADFDISLSTGGAITGSGTGSFIEDAASKTTSLAGGIQISNFCRRQVHGTGDQMNVSLMNISRDELLKPLKDICAKRGLDYDSLVREEVEIISKFRAVISWLAEHNKAAMCEQVVQCLFTLYAAGLLKKISRSKFSVESITNRRLQADIFVNAKGKGIVSKTLHGKSDVSITFNSTSSRSPLENHLHERSVTIEIKHKKLDGTRSQVASCTSQLLAQTLAISKMRRSSEKIVVRSMLTNFSKIRLAVGIKKKESAISYYISTLSMDPLYLVGGIVLLQSKALEKIACSRTVVIDENHDYGEEENIHSDEEEYEENNDERVLGGMSLGGDFSSTSHLAPSRSQLTGKSNTQYKKSRMAFKEIDRNIAISMGDDDQWEELREIRSAWLDKWERNRLGRSYLSAESLKI